KLGVSADIFVCPSDTTPPPGGVSYGINSGLVGAYGKTVRGETRVYWADIGDFDVIVADCDSASFEWSPGVERHRRLPSFIAGGVHMLSPGYRNGYALVVRKNKDIGAANLDPYYPPPNDPPPGGGGEEHTLPIDPD
ncbi:MAG: hypothetical protein JXD21_02485, partial [Candidatus Omnitrophica bacterium]|nr:hypothetical protein [Candidatus Omnitrophota bacterium]